MKRMMIALVIPAVLGLGLGACKKKEETGAASGSAAATGSATATGSAVATGSAAPTGDTTGSAAATGSAAPTGDTPPAAAGERPAIVTEEMVKMADSMVAQMEQMGKDLTAAGTDCKKGAAAIKGNMAKLKPIAESAKKYEKEMKDPAAEEWFKKTYMPRMMGAMGGMMSLAQACQADADFTAAMKEMSDLDM